MTTTETNAEAIVVGLEAALVAAAASRYNQLRSLDAEGDPLVLAQRDALSQTIQDIAAARRRITDGTYGTCTGCGEAIPAARLELRPWAETCVSCVGG